MSNIDLDALEKSVLKDFHDRNIAGDRFPDLTEQIAEIAARIAVITVAKLLHLINTEEVKDLGSKEKNTIIINYGAVNLKSLVITNSLGEYQKRKAQGNTGVLFEPQLMDHGKEPNLYAVGILADT